MESQVRNLFKQAKAKVKDFNFHNTKSLPAAHPTPPLPIHAQRPRVRSASGPPAPAELSVSPAPSTEAIIGNNTEGSATSSTNNDTAAGAVVVRNALTEQALACKDATKEAGKPTLQTTPQILNAAYDSMIQFEEILVEAENKHQPLPAMTHRKAKDLYASYVTARDNIKVGNIDRVPWNSIRARRARHVVDKKLNNITKCLHAWNKSLHAKDTNDIPNDSALLTAQELHAMVNNSLVIMRDLLNTNGTLEALRKALGTLEEQRAKSHNLDLETLNAVGSAAIKALNVAKELKGS